MKQISNSIKYPEAWRIYVDCVRKWKVSKNEEYPTGWKYGIPKPISPYDYLYSDCPGKLFVIFKEIFYQESEIVQFRKFLWGLECLEGKITNQEYKENIKDLESKPKMQ